MGKTYIDSVKYMIYAHFDVNGLVEKPDIVGAIFGQTESLLGEDLDLRNLQKNGRIGRIEVELTQSKNKTMGTIKVPSSLDLVETSIIAATLEVVDRVGPCEAKIVLDKIEDVRNEKRRRIIEKAKQLLKTVLNTQIPNSKELVASIREEVKGEEVVEYGPEKLPASPFIDFADSIIMVEGRADVINLLRNDINNVIAIGGARIPNTIINLSKSKETTVFVDGDRGGDIIIKELLRSGADIDYIVKAPNGKEVEELTRKEIIKVLRNKLPLDQFLQENTEFLAYMHKEENKNKEEQHEKMQKAKKKEKPKTKNHSKSTQKQLRTIKLTNEALMNELNNLEGKKLAELVDKQGNVVGIIPINNLLKELISRNNLYTLIFDGIVTQRLVDLAYSKSIQIIVAAKKGNVKKLPKNMQLIIKS